MKYYILQPEIADDEQDAIIEGKSKYLERINTAFEEGLPLTDDIIEPVEFMVAFNSLRGRMTDHLSVDAIEGLILSEKTKEFFQQQKVKNCEYYKLHIIDNYHNADEVPLAQLKGNKVEFEKRIFEDYFICNITELIDAISHEESELEYFYEERIRKEYLESEEPIDEEININEIDTVIELKLREEQIPEDVVIFRLKDAQHLVVVKESLVEKIEEEKLTGFVFVPVEKFTEEFIEDEDLTEEEVEDEDNEEFPMEEEKELPYKTYSGKNYTKLEWEAFEKRQWEKFKSR